MKEIKYKVIKEYNSFYLCEHPNGYKECFDKFYYKVHDGYITKKIKEAEDGKGLPTEKVNKSFVKG